LGQYRENLFSSHLLDRHNYLRLGHFAHNTCQGEGSTLFLKTFANHLQALLARTLLAQTEPVKP
jgi:hypothetical protein